MNKYKIDARLNIAVSAILFLVFSCSNPVQDPLPKDEQNTKNVINVRLVSPLDQSSIVGMTDIGIEVVSTQPIMRVELLLDNKVVASDTIMKKVIKHDTVLYQFKWNSYFWADDGIHSLSAIAIDSTGQKQNSKVVSVYISSSVLSAIQLIAPQNYAIIRNDDQIELSWKSVDQATKYEVQIAMSYTFDIIEQSHSTNDTSYYSKKLIQATHFWRVRAGIGDSLKGKWCPPQQFTLDGPLAPALVWPTKRTIVPSSNTTTFLWNHSEYAKDYEVQVYQTNSPYSIVSDLIAIDTFTIPVLPLNPYFWKVRGRNNAGFFGRWSDSVTFGYGVFSRSLATIAPPSQRVEMKERPNGGFIILSYPNSLIAINAIGEIEWQKTFNTFSAFSIALSNDGGFLLIGNTDGPLTLAKTSSQGDLEWTKSYLDTVNAYGVRIKNTKDGNYIIAGAYCTCNETKGEFSVYQPILYKVNSSGELQWRSVLSNRRVQPITISESPVGGFMYVGAVVVDPVHVSALLIKTNEVGNVLWEKIPGTRDDPHDGIYTQDAGFITVGISLDQNVSGAFWQKTDTSGQQVWEIAYPNTIYNTANAITEVGTDQFVITGYNDQNYPHSVFFLKINSLGSIQWERKLLGWQGKSIVCTKDNGYCILAVGQGASGLMVTKTNEQGITFEP